MSPKGSVLTRRSTSPARRCPIDPPRRSADGKLNGTKIAVPYAEQADWLVVTADSGSRGGVAEGRRRAGDQDARPSNKGDEYTVTFTDVAVGDDDVLAGAAATAMNQLALAAMGAFASGLVAGALRLTADYVANREQFGKPLSTFQTVAAQLAEVYIASRTLTLAATSVVWRLAEGRGADDDIDVLGYWLASQAPPVMQICHHLHGGMGMDIDYPMDRYYSTHQGPEPAGGRTVDSSRSGGSVMFIELTPEQRQLQAELRQCFRTSSPPRAQGDGGRPARQGLPRGDQADGV